MPGLASLVYWSIFTVLVPRLLGKKPCREFISRLFTSPGFLDLQFGPLILAVGDLLHELRDFLPTWGAGGD